MTDFYVKNINGDLVPAKLLTGLDGNLVIDPNPRQNPVNSLNTNPYFDVNGNQLSINVVNPNNSYIVPKNYDLVDAFKTGSAVGNLAGYAAVGLMVGLFMQGGREDLQRTYQNMSGQTVQGAAGAHVSRRRFISPWGSQ